jgi:putative FmdB family regulatory protein
MPLYDYACYECKNEFVDVKPMAESSTPSHCPECGEVGHKLYKGINVMQTALPDGNRRFDNIREYRVLETAKRREQDKVQKKRIEKEMNKVTGKEAS